MLRLGWNLVVMKTKHDKNSEVARALRLAESKVKTCVQVSATDQKQAHAARVKFKNAKKAWKLARKKAKGSAKLARLANKNLTTLTKHLKKMKKKAQPAKAKGIAASLSAKKSIRPARPAAVSVQSMPIHTAGEPGSNPTGDPGVS